jgi:hypothetical protein
MSKLCCRDLFSRTLIGILVILMAPPLSAQQLELGYRSIAERS